MRGTGKGPAIVAGTPLIVDPLLKRLINSGPVPFRDYMNSALYDEHSGYYSTNIREVGRTGDFSTSTTLNNSLANAIANWIQRIWNQDKDLPRSIIEIGAGNGSLAKQIIKRIGFWSRLRLDYHIVETSEPLLKLQVQRLGKRKPFQWHKDPRSALESCSGKALIISNELIDAFPVELIQWEHQKEKWRRVMVHSDNQGWTTSVGNDYEIPKKSSLLELHNFKDGQRVERHDDFVRWFHSWIGFWEQGHMLSIDYGDEFPTLYERRPNGTVRAYFAQNRFEQIHEILARPGHQDITSDIDFTDIRNRLLIDGLKEIKYQTQAEFIADHEISASTGDPSTNPHGAGEAFKVLWHRKT
ncbi:MAG: SAM-dependent methyltransferase [Verrucomicrobiales bacterium]|jgi:SAM-dependent MidA family methyltransferase|nr:SAM-dependent methyltransferase [Verrucomicrobiales bacterium]